MLFALLPSMLPKTIAELVKPLPGVEGAVTLKVMVSLSPALKATPVLQVTVVVPEHEEKRPPGVLLTKTL